MAQTNIGRPRVKEPFSMNVMYLVLLAKILKKHKITYGSQIAKEIQQITKIFDKNNMYAWNSKNGSIYRLLDMLEEKGIIRYINSADKKQGKKMVELIDEKKLDELIEYLQASIHKDLQHLLGLYTSAMLFIYEEKGMQDLKQLIDNCWRNISA